MFSGWWLPHSFDGVCLKLWDSVASSFFLTSSFLWRHRSEESQETEETTEGKWVSLSLSFDGEIRRCSSRIRVGCQPSKKKWKRQNAAANFIFTSSLEIYKRRVSGCLSAERRNTFQVFCFLSTVDSTYQCSIFLNKIKINSNAKSKTTFIWVDFQQILTLFLMHCLFERHHF